MRSRALACPAYRVHVPRWAYAPTSGAGAAEHGGRLNRPGLPALYLALDTATALEEYRQLSALVPPGLVVSYELRIASVIDFSSGYSPDWARIVGGLRSVGLRCANPTCRICKIQGLDDVRAEQGLLPNGTATSSVVTASGRG